MEYPPRKCYTKILMSAPFFLFLTHHGCDRALWGTPLVCVTSITGDTPSGNTCCWNVSFLTKVYHFTALSQGNTTCRSCVKLACDELLELEVVVMIFPSPCAMEIMDWGRALSLGDGLAMDGYGWK